ncbi:MAG TPA: carbohydrate kinase [Myxococcales bacterium]|nr:carbohydrate kinase [Myxococcales bacterium]
MLDAVCFGEALVDLLPDRRGHLSQCESFAAHSGGAPANVAVGLSRLGLQAAFVGVVGDDEFGHLLSRKLAEAGVRVELRFSAEAKTGVWFIAIDEQGDRSFFTPTGAQSADKLIDESDAGRVPLARIFHCGSAAHVRPEARRALRAAVRSAKERGMMISFDPNVRTHLWSDLRELRALCDEVLPQSDLVKLSEDELEICLGVSDPAAALDRLAAMGVKLGCVTLGARGAAARRGGETVEVPAPAVEVVDTTGAGDGFVAALLASDPLHADLGRALRFACAVGSRVCTRLGAVAGLPTLAEAEPLRRP